uniref:Sec-independent protein translocase protein TatB n=1 Tax=Candidatus Kentrum sp. LPFa TaxID=2126335 RepID=A0A450Y2C1_9GAMM|nr:MAG: sec-independent protein translocase protein TatB [Candidatus Kentron sp. LPFa]VFK35707.1 MAG: sec-independent protein translocase protein TatB [Candidatus Kentron sp. LPFa]
MFDIGFWEVTIIAIIALLVIGPDRLPEFARTTGLWIRKARQFLSGVKSDIDRELRAEDLKRILKQQEEFNAVHEIIEETKATITETSNQLSSIGDSTDSAESSSNKSDSGSPPGNTLSSPTSGNTTDTTSSNASNTSAIHNNEQVSASRQD